jgi:thiol-disulfide isomerase/thioredoxin
MIRFALLVAVGLAIAGCNGPDRSQAPIRRTTVKITVFTASWCGPCHDAKPRLEWMRSKGRCELQYVDVDRNKRLADKYGVTSIPAYVVCDGKTCVWVDNIAEVEAIVARY